MELYVVRFEVDPEFINKNKKELSNWVVFGEFKRWDGGKYLYFTNAHPYRGVPLNSSFSSAKKYKKIEAARNTLNNLLSYGGIIRKAVVGGSIIGVEVEEGKEVEKIKRT